MARTHTPPRGERPKRATTAKPEKSSQSDKPGKAGAIPIQRKPATPRAADGAQPAAAAPAMKARAPRYDFATFEERWRTQWEASGIYRVDLDAAPRPFYNLMMFPYPSAEGLHIGNVFTYVGVDIQGRWMAMRGYDVFEPMGFDAFGIHSENFAIKRGIHPAILTAQNVERFRERQLKRIGARFDWSREVNTTDPAYYRWTQWIFTQLFKMGLAERKTGVVNWCPNDKTVLADEQVIDGHCERCGALVERRELPHWALRITAYADRLLDHLDTLDWSERVKAAQRHWIGRSTGVEFAFEIAGQPDASVDVFTTRPDTVFGATFVVLAPEHPLAERIAAPERRDAIAAYRIGAVARRVERERERADTTPTGVFTGAFAIHPITGERIPIWIADYVLMEYGTGAIMAVPAHDERDWTFAHVMGLPIRPVVQSPEATPADAPYTGEGTLALSGEFSGMSSVEARDAIGAAFEARQIGRRITRYHLRDWLISRQRYWGPPIPIIYCPDHGAVAVPDDQLPVRLPDLEDYRPEGTGDSPLARIESFVHTTCPVCGKPATRDTDVMDNFVDSSWYYLRYPSTDDDTQAWNPERTRKWLPVNLYVGGPEHSVLHLLYARFIAMAMHDAGYLDFDEPFTRFRAHGMITLNGEKISKSKGNIINPDDYLAEYGADALRVYLMFMGPYEVGGDFSDRGVAGVVRFLERVWRLFADGNVRDGAPSAEDRRTLHLVARKVGDDTAAMKYNTAIAEMMRYSGEVEARSMPATREEAQMFLRLLAPYAPYISEELWSRIGGAGFVHQQAWPEADEEAMRAETATVVVQVDGRLRAQLTLAATATQEDAQAAALTTDAVRRAVADREVRQVIFVPGRLINLVTRG
ncbi:MAG TPA: leucine--tRNA ligase [Ktedonobacterales bacterium]